MFVVCAFTVFVYYSSRYKLGVDEIEGMIIDMTNNNTGTTLAIFVISGHLERLLFVMMIPSSYMVNITLPIIKMVTSLKERQSFVFPSSLNFYHCLLL